MKKKLDEAAIANELRGGSLHFQRPAEDAPAATAQQGGATVPVQESKPTAPAPLPNPPADDGPYGRTAVRTLRRTLKRHPFEFYKDQLDQLKQIALTEELAGGRGNMSEMVRAAVDEWLAKHTASENGLETEAG